MADVWMFNHATVQLNLNDLDNDTVWAYIAGNHIQNHTNTRIDRGSATQIVLHCNHKQIMTRVTGSFAVTQYQILGVWGPFWDANANGTPWYLRAMLIGPGVFAAADKDTTEDIHTVSLKLEVEDIKDAEHVHSGEGPCMFSHPETREEPVVNSS